MTNPDLFNLFIYGSLRSHFRSPVYDYISRYFDLVGNAEVRGRLYDLGEYPAAVPDQGDHWIKGELYTIKNPKEFGWAVCQLDDYEGVLVEPHEKPLYRREPTTVRTGDKESQAWIYWYNGDISGKPLIESGDLLSYVKQK